MSNRTGEKKYSKRGFPDYAKRYRDKTGKNLCDLLEKMSDNQIREEFKNVGLNAPSLAFLEYFRDLFSDPKKMASRINSEFEEFVTSKLGMGYVNENNILNSLILIGFKKIKDDLEVDTSQLLKAIELKKKYDDGEGKGTGIEEMVNAIFEGQKKTSETKNKKETKPVSKTKVNSETNPVTKK